MLTLLLHERHNSWLLLKMSNYNLSSTRQTEGKRDHDDSSPRFHRTDHSVFVSSPSNVPAETGRAVLSTINQRFGVLSWCSHKFVDLASIFCNHEDRRSNFGFAANCASVCGSEWTVWCKVRKNIRWLMVKFLKRVMQSVISHFVFSFVA